MNQKLLTPEEKAERDRQQREREAAMRLKNNRLGLTVFQASWILIFVCLVIVYWQMGYQPGWRPTAEQRPDMILPTIATLALLASGWLAHQSLKAIEANRVKAFLSKWQSTLGLGAVFFIIMVTQFFVVPANEGALYGYIYRVMIGYHAIHALIIGYIMFQVWRNGKAGQYHSDKTWAIEGSTKLWYFVIGAWILFYIVLYLI